MKAELVSADGRSRLTVVARQASALKQTLLQARWGEVPRSNSAENPCASQTGHMGCSCSATVHFESQPSAHCTADGDDKVHRARQARRRCHLLLAPEACLLRLA